MANPMEVLDAEHERVKAQLLTNPLYEGIEEGESLTVTVEESDLSYTEMERVCQRFIDVEGWMSVEATPALRGGPTDYTFTL